MSIVARDGHGKRLGEFLSSMIKQLENRDIFVAA
jgi:hypothetical protein